MPKKLAPESGHEGNRVVRLRDCSQTRVQKGEFLHLVQSAPASHLMRDTQLRSLRPYTPRFPVSAL